MSPCDIPLRVLIFFILSPSFLLINIIIAYEILHFQTILYYNSSGDGEAKPKISFPFLFPLRGGGVGGGDAGKIKKKTKKKQRKKGGGGNGRAGGGGGSRQKSPSLRDELGRDG